MEQPFENTEARFAPELIAERLARARETIATLSDGRRTDLLCVTKTVPAEVINYAIDHLGVDAIGENRVQELLEKYDKLHKPAGGKLTIHLIGSLQTNKVKYIIDKVDMIESVDSVKLAAEIDRQAKRAGIIMDILVEINIGREPQKGGVLPENLPAFLDELDGFSSLRLRGLMTVAPKCQEPDEYRKYFTETYHYFIDISQNYRHNRYMESDPREANRDTIDRSHFDTLSMGMSGSFREAILCGATEIRLGSTVFGERSVEQMVR